MATWDESCFCISTWIFKEWGGMDHVQEHEIGLCCHHVGQLGWKGLVLYHIPLCYVFYSKGWSEIILSNRGSLCEGLRTSESGKPTLVEEQPCGQITEGYTTSYCCRG